MPPPDPANPPFDLTRKESSQERPVAGIKFPDLLPHIGEPAEQFRRLIPAINFGQWTMRTVGVHTGPLRLGQSLLPKQYLPMSSQLPFVKP